MPVVTIEQIALFQKQAMKQVRPIVPLEKKCLK